MVVMVAMKVVMVLLVVESLLAGKNLWRGPEKKAIRLKTSSFDDWQILPSDEFPLREMPSQKNRDRSFKLLVGALCVRQPPQHPT